MSLSFGAITCLKQTCVEPAIVFAVQIITALSLVMAAFINMSVGKPEQHDLWLVLLSSAIAYKFLSPTLKRRMCETETDIARISSELTTHSILKAFQAHRKLYQYIKKHI